VDLKDLEDPEGTESNKTGTSSCFVFLVPLSFQLGTQLRTQLKHLAVNGGRGLARWHSAFRLRVVIQYLFIQHSVDEAFHREYHHVFSVEQAFSRKYLGHVPLHSCMDEVNEPLGPVQPYSYSRKNVAMVCK
jgi:hypothetical protein